MQRIKVIYKNYNQLKSWFSLAKPKDDGEHAYIW